MDVKITILAPELSAALQALAEAIQLTQCTVGDTPIKVLSEDTCSALEEAIEEENPAPDVPWYTLEQVRAKLAALAQAGKQKEVKGLITSFSVKKLTDLPEEKYAELMEKAEELA